MRTIEEIQATLGNETMVDDVSVVTTDGTHIRFQCFLGQDVTIHPSSFRSFVEEFTSLGGYSQYQLTGSSDGVTLTISVPWSNVLDDYQESK